MNKTKLLTFIKEQVPEATARDISDAIYAAYSRAELLAKQEIMALGHERMRGYMRREFCNDVLAQFGEAKHTNPMGEKYGLIQFNSMNMLAFCVNTNGPERPATYKRELAKMNELLLPDIPDLFDANSELVRSSLHTCLMIVNPKGKGSDPKHPMAIQLVVPYTNRKGFHLNISLEEWLSSYNEEIVESAGAWPTFRKEILSIEKDKEQD